MLEMKTFARQETFGLRLGMPLQPIRRRLSQAAAACPASTPEAFAAASNAQNSSWEGSGKSTLVGVCAIVNDRIMQECRFPDGYASAQDVPASGPPPATCDAQWAQRQSAPPMSGRQLGQTPAAPTGTEGKFAEVLAAPKAVVLFYSPSCPYSQKFMPIFESIAQQYPDVMFAALNVEQFRDNAVTYKVRMLPTAIYLVNGQEVNRIDGVGDQGDFVTEMNKAFSPTPTVTPGPEPARAGTLIQAVPAPSPISTPALVVGGLVGAGLLAAIGYAIFGK